MATYAARRLQEMVENTAGILSIELLAACQGIEFRRPRRSSDALEKVVAKVREVSAAFDVDRPFHEDIAAVREHVFHDVALLSLVQSRIF